MRETIRHLKQLKQELYYTIPYEFVKRTKPRKNPISGPGTNTLATMAMWTVQELDDIIKYLEGELDRSSRPDC